MYMPDALHAAIQIMEADPTRLQHRNSFNIASMSFDPEIIANNIRKYIPDFQMEYKVDPLRQAIADSWPNSLMILVPVKNGIGSRLTIWIQWLKTWSQNWKNVSVNNKYKRFVDGEGISGLGCPLYF